MVFWRMSALRSVAYVHHVFPREESGIGNDILRSQITERVKANRRADRLLTAMFLPVFHREGTGRKIPATPHPQAVKRDYVYTGTGTLVCLTTMLDDISQIKATT